MYWEVNATCSVGEKKESIESGIFSLLYSLRVLFWSALLRGFHRKLACQAIFGFEFRVVEFRPGLSVVETCSVLRDGDRDGRDVGFIRCHLA